MERDYERLKHFLVPNLSDWTRTGRVLRQLAEKYGFERIGQGRLTNGALIAMSAARLRLQGFTANEWDTDDSQNSGPFSVPGGQPLTSPPHTHRLLRRRRILRFRRNA
jgi:hypothetical protein